jgi:hypothetical protein
MIDNFLNINRIFFNQKEQLQDDYFYHLQIIQRKKDIEELGCNNILLKAIIIDDAHPLEKFKDYIIDMCEHYRARAYINVGPKSKRKVAVQMLQDLAQCFAKNDFNYTKKLWNTAAGTVNPFLKRWVIDCDITDKFTIEDIQNVINIVYESNSEEKYKIIGTIPTLHGYHIITTPFDLRKLKEEYPSIDIHKNNPTVLYVPDSLMK